MRTLIANEYDINLNHKWHSQEELDKKGDCLFIQESSQELLVSELHKDMKVLRLYKHDTKAVKAEYWKQYRNLIFLRSLDFALYFNKSIRPIAYFEDIYYFQPVSDI